MAGANERTSEALRQPGIFGGLILLFIAAGVLVNIALLCLLYWGPDQYRLENSARAILVNNPQDWRGRFLLQAAVARQRALCGANDPGLARTLVLLAKDSKTRGLNAQFETEMKQAIAIEEANIKEKQKDAAQARILVRVCSDSLLELSSYYQALGRWADSGLQLNEVVQLTSIAPPTQAQLVALGKQLQVLESQHSIKRRTHIQLGQSPPPDWITSKRQFSRLVDQTLSGLSPARAKMHAATNLQGFLTGTSTFYFESGRYEQSAGDLSEIVALGRHLPQRSFYATVSLDRLGNVNMLEKKYDQAQWAYRGALVRLAAEHGPNQDAYRAIMLRAYSELLKDNGRSQESSQLSTEASGLLKAWRTQTAGP